MIYKLVVRMQIQNAIPPPDLIKLFDFLDSDTPATWEWVISYLIKQGFIVPTQRNPFEQVSLQVAKFVTMTYRGDIKAFARKMRNAFRVRKHRKNKDVATLSISLDKATAAKLSQMSKGHKKTEIVALLIQNNYQGFLAVERELRAQLAEAKKQRDFEKQQKLLKTSIKTKSQTNNQTECATEELRDGIAALYDIIFAANEQGREIDDQSLLQATKIYYAAFAK